MTVQPVALLSKCVKQGKNNALFLTGQALTHQEFDVINYHQLQAIPKAITYRIFNLPQQAQDPEWLRSIYGPPSEPAFITANVRHQPLGSYPGQREVEIILDPVMVPVPAAAKEGLLSRINQLTEAEYQEGKSTWSRITERATSPNTKNYLEHLDRFLQQPIPTNSSIYQDGDRTLLERLARTPAAVRNHHTIQGGLLKHTDEMQQLASALFTQAHTTYPTLRGHYSPTNYYLLQLAISVHDMGKMFEYHLPRYGQPRSNKNGYHTIVSHILQPALPNSLTAPPWNLPVPFPTADHNTLLSQQEANLFLHFCLAHHGKIETGSPQPALHPISLIMATVDRLSAALDVLSTSQTAQDAGQEPEYNQSLDGTPTTYGQTTQS